MQRNRYWFFRFARRESDNFVGPINRLPSHVGDVAKPCASVIAEKNCTAPIAVRRLHELRYLRRSKGRPFLCGLWQSFKRSRGIRLNIALPKRSVERGTYNLHGKIGRPRSLTRRSNGIAVGEHVLRADVSQREISAAANRCDEVANPLTITIHRLARAHPLLHVEPVVQPIANLLI